jgi:hypothetical protein
MFKYKKNKFISLKNLLNNKKSYKFITCYLCIRFFYHMKTFQPTIFFTPFTFSKMLSKE